MVSIGIYTIHADTFPAVYFQCLTGVFIAFRCISNTCWELHGASVFRIRIHWYRYPGSGSNPDPGFLWPKIEKITTENKIKFYIFLIKICNPLIPRHPRTFKLQEKPLALKRDHPANKKFLNFFLFLWVIFCPPRSTDLIEFGSNPDPEHCGACRNFCSPVHADIFQMHAEILSLKCCNKPDPPPSPPPMACNHFAANSNQ